MTQDQIIEQKIEQNYRSRPWLGVVPVEQAIAAAVEYRLRLRGEPRRLFDEAILKGWLPERAIDMIEYAVEKGILQKAAPAEAELNCIHLSQEHYNQFVAALNQEPQLPSPKASRAAVEYNASKRDDGNFDW